ncbi:glycosyltransferase, partial [Enterococcus faecium]|nr:glycosyltransferase [Enterococcus faecium]
YKPDIIHLHNIHGYYLNVQILFNFLKKSKIPIVWTFHDSWAFSGHAAYIEYDKNGTLPNKNSNFAERYAYPKSFINRSYYNFERKKRLFSNVDNLTIVTPSNWLNKMVKMSFLKDYQVITINNGINLEKFEKTEQKTGIKKGNKKEVLAVANIWEKRKGLEDIIYFAEKLDERKYHFIIVGKVGRTLPANISHIDRTDNLEQLIQLYQQADVFINPTYQDNFPTTNIEALAAGTPVITYNTGGSGEILTEDVGFVIEQGNREKFIEKISEIRKDINISNYCMQTAQIYSVKNMNRKYILIYEKTKNGSC